jgi:hypothetical protein
MPEAAIQRDQQLYSQESALYVALVRFALARSSALINHWGNTLSNLVLYTHELQPWNSARVYVVRETTSRGKW